MVSKIILLYFSSQMNLSVLFLKDHNRILLETSHDNKELHLVVLSSFSIFKMAKLPWKWIKCW